MGALKSIEQKYFGLKARMNFIQLIRNPEATTTIFQLSDNLQKATPPELLEKYVEGAYQNPDLQRAYEAKYFPQMPSFAELEQMPEGSFGRELAHFITRNHLDFDLFPENKGGTRSDYLRSRVYQSHDAWHVLTGYSTDLVDELALQAFGVAQYKQGLSLLIISGGIFNLLNHNPEVAPRVLAAISDGFERGRKAKNLLTEPVLERLRDPLGEMRQDLGLSISNF